jgi:hypothetical protein
MENSLRLTELLFASEEGILPVELADEEVTSRQIPWRKID